MLNLESKTAAGFWELQQPGESVAAIDAASGKQWSYSNLREDAERFASALPKLYRKALGLVVTRNCYECLVAYVAALRGGNAIILSDATVPSALIQGLITVYQPDWIFSADSDGCHPDYQSHATGISGLCVNKNPAKLDIFPDLALLLSTSGSTGSPKLVRLTLQNIAANAQSIADFLKVTSTERPITSLPLSYSYGLSVINSHLSVGAAVVLATHSVLRREFWDAVDRYRCTSFAGVPYTFQILLQTGLLNGRAGSLTTVTQAGGKLDDHSIRKLHQLALRRGWKVFIMYGQTEATARISYLPSDRLAVKIGSVGVVVPGGCISLDEDTSELIYQGPNVMLGYAECREDLAKGDELHGVLRTGDLARLDSEGFLYITGRLKRYVKLFGRRFSLDDVEIILSRTSASPVACWGRDDLLIIAVEKGTDPAGVVDSAREVFGLPRTAVRGIAVESLPRKASGKLDYQRLAESADAVTMAGTA